VVRQQKDKYRKIQAKQTTLAMVQEQLRLETPSSLITGPPPPYRRNDRRIFTPAEDAVIMRAMLVDTSESWTAIASLLEGRTAYQCRRRWKHYLAPEVRREPWIPEEDRLLVEKFNEIGENWVAMRPFFNGRSYIDIGNRWRRHVKPKTVHDGTKFRYREMDASSPENKQKKSGRFAPKKAALAILERTLSSDTAEALRLKSAARSVPDPFENAGNSQSLPTKHQRFKITLRHRANSGELVGK
jgi:hypothetical protein